ncbi:hypothetical protein PspLS_00758 [Pyricularia sp. CBS 133598]|nr:hypothetical protein PspLS_00758 [Pyricularia sp. CBS 133598]
MVGKLGRVVDDSFEDWMDDAWKLRTRRLLPSINQGDICTPQDRRSWYSYKSDALI